jgi:hypothetical protein
MTARYVVHDDQGPDLEFEGELLVDADHRDVGFVKVFRTSSGKYVLTQNHSSRPGVLIRKRTVVLESLEEVGEELGWTRGAKAIREQLGLSTRRQI